MLRKQGGQSSASGSQGGQPGGRPKLPGPHTLPPLASTRVWKPSGTQSRRLGVCGGAGRLGEGRGGLSAVLHVVTFPEQINSAPGTYYPASEFVFPIPVRKENVRHFVLTYFGAMSLSS